MASHRNFLRVSLLLPFVLVGAQTVDFNTFIENRKEAVAELARKVGSALETTSWCASSTNCNESCAYNTCSGTIGTDATCMEQFYVESCADRDRPGLQLTNECFDTQYPNGSKLNYNRPDYRTYIGGVQSSGDGQPITVVDDLLRRDLCALKTAEDDFVSLFDKYNLSLWYYAGTANRAFFSMPGATRCRDENAENKLESCGYDPTSRPWYITAASGPRDIVFLFDKTSLTSESSILKKSFYNLLGTLDSRDRIAVVAFSNDAAPLLPQQDGLTSIQAATSNFTGQIKAELTALRDDSGLPNTTLAFQTAFNLLQSADGTQFSSNCSKFIVAMIGGQDLCHSSCDSDKPCSCVSQLSRYIETRQSALSSFATIVTFTESTETDVLRTNNLERLARTIVCSNEASGAWHGVQEGESENTAMSAFIQLGAQFLYQDELKVFSSELYEDSSGLGKMFTLAVPVYSNDVKQLLAVAALDMTVTEVMEQTGLDIYQSSVQIGLLGAASRDCPSLQTRTGCPLQALRDQFGSPICTDTLPTNRYECFAFGEDTYLPVSTPKSFGEAQEYCANISSGSSLAVVDSSGKSEYISRLASKDGAWIGLRADVDEDLKWVDGTTLEDADARFSYNYKSVLIGLHDDTNEDVCVTADARGVDGNWNLESCRSSRPFICQIILDDTITICNTTYVDQNYNSVNPLDCADQPLSSRTCTEAQDEALKYAQPFCAQNGSDFSEKQRVCCIDPYSDETAITEPPASPPSQAQQNSPLSTGAIVGIVIGAVVVVGCVFCALLYFRRSDSENSPPEEEKIDRSARQAAARKAAGLL